MENTIQSQFAEHIELAMFCASEYTEPLLAATELAKEIFLRGGKLISIGNGRAATLASYLAVRLYQHADSERPPLPVLSLINDGVFISEIAAQDSFKLVFSQQLRAIAQPQDALVIFSSSGQSSNVIQAIEQAHHIGLSVILFSTQHSLVHAMLRTDDIDLCLAQIYPDRASEIYLLMINCWCTLIEQALFGETSDVQ